jgi:hypothetical protein
MRVTQSSEHLMMLFFARHTDVGDCAVPQSLATPQHRGVSNWKLQRVARPGQPADNEPWPEYAPRGQVWITRLGAYTRVVLLAEEPTTDVTPPISTQRWA